MQNIKNNTSNQSYTVKEKHQTIMILTIITCRTPNQHNITTTTQQQDLEFEGNEKEYIKLNLSLNIRC